ncbi:suppressor APC domain-containing protein 2 isoform X1 [Toxotes jaculatrix]|uniref:suppressor APC domain-containing protein 2 isoform X1 n=1 Tax=Toxotes jaculatrix TaxID=941984 RepID=UPI001B3B041E|nr:suppressor APC domain-containing protein 2 isoform X1 [Toxotes jaculatrix]XP_040915687.1 suppressor APC domain-containing protein 2 isoform X1 [Toxotes jaculatrix]
MALIATDRGCKLNGTSAIYGRVEPRKEVFQGKAERFKTVKMQPKETEYSTDGLPKAFLHSLRTLFDILDDGGRGYVHISEIESRWQGADTRELPGGVLGCLRRVTPPHGCLTFERFVAGLRYSMLNPENSSHFKAQAAVHPQQAPKQHQKPAPLSTCSVGTRVENKVRPLGPSNVTNTQQHRASNLQSRVRLEEGAGYPACGPARYSAGFERSGRSLERIPVAPEGGCYRTDPGHATKPTQPQQSRVRSIESLALESPQLQGPSVVKSGLPRSQSESATGFTGGSRRHGRSREEQRRHTISNGVDYGMLKQMKELEQEKDSLLAGLEVVERARDWYQGQIHNVTERQRQVGQSSHCTDFFTEANQSRMNVLIPKLQEVNQCLNDLISCTGMQSFPSSSAQTAVLSATSQPPAPAPPQAIQRLKDQNRLLTQEVTEKSERIAQLEQEKSALIKQLFEARARSAQDTSTMDSTFI